MPWQPFATAPKDGTVFLAAWTHEGTGQYMVHAIRWQNGHFMHTWDHGILTALPSHWMPLPAPPAAIDAPERDATR